MLSLIVCTEQSLTRTLYFLQSSCSLQNSGTKKACPEHKYDISQLKQRKSPSSDIISQKDELGKEGEQSLMHDGKAQGNKLILINSHNLQLFHVASGKNVQYCLTLAKCIDCMQDQCQFPKQILKY